MASVGGYTIKDKASQQNVCKQTKNQTGFCHNEQKIILETQKQAKSVGNPKDSDKKLVKETRELRLKAL